MLLKIDKLNCGYGGLKVLFDLSLQVEKGECVALVGSNGAGKTTLLRVISGVNPITSGTVYWEDKNITNVPAHLRPELGIAHIPQGRGILTTLSIYDNLMLGAYCKRSRPRRAELMAKVLDMFPILKARLHHEAGTLSGGQQQMLAIGRALMLDPTLLVLDEPSLGLAPIVVDEVFRTIDRVKEQGTSILLIEQNLVQALAVADRGYVIETGHINIQGPSKDLMHNEDVRKAYLGI